LDVHFPAAILEILVEISEIIYWNELVIALFPFCPFSVIMHQGLLLSTCSNLLRIKADLGALMHDIAN